MQVNCKSLKKKKILIKFPDSRNSMIQYWKNLLICHPEIKF